LLPSWFLSLHPAILPSPNKLLRPFRCGSTVGPRQFDSERTAPSQYFAGWHNRKAQAGGEHFLRDIEDRGSDSFEVIDEVLVQGVVVIPKGAPALATVTDAEPKRRMGRGGKLDVNVDSVRLADGEKAQLRAVKDTKGGGHVGAMTGAMVATLLVFFPAAPLFLFMHGKSVDIPKGTEVTAFVQGDMHLVMANFGAGGSGSMRWSEEELQRLELGVVGAFAGGCHVMKLPEKMQQ
jgi:hypothetical protein